MKVDRLLMQSFRAYTYAELRFDSRLTVICGGNAQGKTSILEALSVLSAGRSFRARRDKEMIRFEDREARLFAEVERAGRRFDLAVKLAEGGKQALVNRVAQKSLSGFLGHFQAIVFTPDDLCIVKDGPEERRRFLNMAMAQRDPSFISVLQSYTQLLSGRNQLLRLRQTTALDVWDERLALAAETLHDARQTFLGEIGAAAAREYRPLSSAGEELEIQARPGTPGSARQPYSARLAEAMRASLAVDLKRGFTSVGPHRDDFSISLSGLSAAAFASQGQQRSIVLALKLAQAYTLYEKSSEWPVLLLDDVLSELDEKRQAALYPLIQRTQTILTAAHLADTLRNLLGTPKVFEVARGIILD